MEPAGEQGVLRFQRCLPDPRLQCSSGGLRDLELYRALGLVPHSDGASRHLAGSSGRTLQRQYRNLYHLSMKTTLDLNDQLLADAKALAAQQRTSLTRLIEEGLQLRIRAQASAPKRRRVRLPAYKGRGGLVAGVNPLSNKALLEALGDDA